MNNNKNYQVDFKVPPYNSRVRIVICSNVDDYIEQEFGERPELEYACYVYNKFGQPKSAYDLLLILDYEHCDEGTLVHETGHIVIQILRYIGMTLSRSSEEGYCYLLDWVYTKIRQHVIVAKSSKLAWEEGYQILNKKEDGNKSKEVLTTTNSMAKVESE